MDVLEEEFGGISQQQLLAPVDTVEVSCEVSPAPEPYISHFIGWTCVYCLTVLTPISQ